MVERELSMHVPQAAQLALGKELRALKARRITLNARYYDTPERELASARIALRIRKEGKQWVQTLKSPGADPLSRVELNHARPEPVLDLSVYHDTPFAAILERFSDRLTLRFETRVTRLIYCTRYEDSEVELSFDRGEIHAANLRLPISEIEFELISGESEAMFALGAEWLSRYGLILEFRSKAERGDALAKLACNEFAEGDPESELAPQSEADPREPTSDELEHIARARRPASVNLKAKSPILQAYVDCVNECVTQIIRNATFAAGVDTAQADNALHVDYTHQLRVGIRRLRSCWKLFEGWAPPVDAEIVQLLRDQFSKLGDTRNNDVIRLYIAPELERAGMPATMLPFAESPVAHETSTAGESGFQMLALRLLKGVVFYSDVAEEEAQSLADSPDAKPVPIIWDNSQFVSDVPLKRALTKRLNEWRKKVLRQGLAFDSLSIDEQHDARKKIKRLRYALQFASGLFSSAKLEPFFEALEEIQQVLGALNDYYMAEAFYAELTRDQPQAWFAIGWLRARQADKQAEAKKAFKRFDKLGKI